MADTQAAGIRPPRKFPAVRSAPRMRLSSSYMPSLPLRRLKDILSHVLPHITLISTEELKTAHLTRLFLLKMSDGSKLQLTFAPSLVVRLLRQESSILSTEVAVLKFIAGSRIQQEHMQMVERAPSKSKGEENGEKEARSEAEEEGVDDEYGNVDDQSSRFLALVPRLLKHSMNNCELAYPYSIIGHTPGEPLSRMAPFLSPHERHDIDRQIGSMARTFVDLTSPTGNFGKANIVLSDLDRPASSRPLAMTGCKSWSEGFNTLLEGILRDGEDMAVLLPYEVIREHFQNLVGVLDAVTIPRLVVLDIDDPINVMVERDPDDEETMLPSENIRVTGLQNWSQIVFGDPLVASCFDEPKNDFREGWDAAGKNIIEDKENSETRILLYRCYRLAAAIVTEYYRPRGDSGKRELAARRNLTQVLSDLEQLEVVKDNGPKRTLKHSTDAGTPKRVKIEADNES